MQHDNQFKTYNPLSLFSLMKKVTKKIKRILENAHIVILGVKYALYGLIINLKI